jgi:hypothetical protein
MSYSSKRTIVSIIAGLILITAYIIYALGTAAPASEDLKGWAVAILVFIAISVAVTIIIQILFHIALAIGIAVKERQCEDKEVERIISSTMVEDERDKLISLKSSHIGYICAGIGFVAALVALAFGMTSITALHILFGTFATGSIIEGIVSVYYYENGVCNG